MEYIQVEARFLFFNGVKRYTVEYSYGLSKWFVFTNDNVSGAIFQKEDKKIKFKNVNSETAQDILYEYLNK